MLFHVVSAKKFSVASKNVGCLVYQLYSFSCEAFKCFFHLWGNGGANWQKEFRVWQKECQVEWTLVSPNKRRTDHALLALRRKTSESIFRNQFKSPQVNSKLSFAAIEAYHICQWYEFLATYEQVADSIQARYVCSQLERMDWVIFSHSIFQSNL
jgi:hypothetical protein